MGTRGSSGRRRPAAENVANKPGRGRKAWDTTKEVATRSALIAAALSAAYWGGRIAGYPLNKKTYEQNIDRAVRYAETMDEAGPKRPAVLYRIMSPELTRLLNVERGFIRSPDQRAAKRLYSLLPQKSKTLYRDILEFELERQFNRMISDLERVGDVFERNQVKRILEMEKEVAEKLGAEFVEEFRRKSKKQFVREKLDINLFHLERIISPEGMKRLAALVSDIPQERIAYIEPLIEKAAEEYVRAQRKWSLGSVVVVAGLMAFGAAIKKRRRMLESKKRKSR